MSELSKTKESRLKTTSPQIFIVAFLLFCLLNIIPFKINVVKFDPFQYPRQNWAWWLLNDLRTKDAHYNIATIGSSLMTYAICNSDATYLHKDLDLALHHTADYFDNTAKRFFYGNFKTINLSTLGQMPSDSLLITKAALNLGHHPDVLIYGLGPRDFVDSTFQKVSDTDAFPYLSRIVNCDNLESRNFDFTFSGLNHWLQNSFYLYRHAPDIQMTLGHPVEILTNKMCPQAGGAPRFSPADRLKILPNYKADEVCPGTRCVPLGKFELSTKWVRDIRQQYVISYRDPSPKTFRTQLDCLKQLAMLCQKEHIQLILVNMPISAENLALLTRPRYDNYLRSLGRLASQNKVPLFDFNKPGQNCNGYFEDEVHLNALGGKLLCDNLLSCFASDATLKEHFVVAARKQSVSTKLAQKDSPVPH